MKKQMWQIHEWSGPKSHERFSRCSFGSSTVARNSSWTFGAPCKAHSLYYLCEQFAAPNLWRGLSSPRLFPLDNGLIWSKNSRLNLKYYGNIIDWPWCSSNGMKKKIYSFLYLNFFSWFHREIEKSTYIQQVAQIRTKIETKIKIRFVLGLRCVE